MLKRQWRQYNRANKKAKQVQLDRMKRTGNHFYGNFHRAEKYSRQNNVQNSFFHAHYLDLIKMFKWLSGHLMINKKRQRKFPYSSFIPSLIIMLFHS
ncbi:MAG: hypothetical protein LKH78_03400 [Weizmannia coagulans]|nr:hypothetical protein [Heyndrickxia coagulans]